MALQQDARKRNRSASGNLRGCSHSGLYEFERFFEETMISFDGIGRDCWTEAELHPGSKAILKRRNAVLAQIFLSGYIGFSNDADSLHL